MIDDQRWDEWEKNHPELIGTALGDPWPASFESFLATKGVAVVEFKNLLQNLVEIVFGSFYAAANDTESLGCLARVIEIATAAGAELPPLAPFSKSHFADRSGWGRKLTVAERDAWRKIMSLK